MDSYANTSIVIAAIAGDTHINTLFLNKLLKLRSPKTTILRTKLINKNHFILISVASEGLG